MSVGLGVLCHTQIKPWTIMATDPQGGILIFVDVLNTR